MKMNLYVVFNFSNGELLERFESFEKWEDAKKAIEASKIIYVTPEIDDPELKDFKEICWERYEPGYRNHRLKIMVPFIPNDIEEMQRLSQIQIEEYRKKYQKIKEEVNAKHEEKKQKRKEKLKKERENFCNAMYEVDPEYYNLCVTDVHWFKCKDIKEMEGLEGYDALMLWRELGFPMPAPIQVIREKENLCPEGTWKDFMARTLSMDISVPSESYDANRIFSDPKEKELNDLYLAIEKNFAEICSLHSDGMGGFIKTQERYDEIIGGGIKLWKRYAKLCKEIRESKESKENKENEGV